MFEHHAEVRRRTLADKVLGVEHVGSTAVVGLVAKPIVDVAVRLAPGVNQGRVVISLEGRGYVFRGDKGGERRPAVRRCGPFGPGEPPTFTS